jgi:hypothetical protein
MNDTKHLVELPFFLDEPFFFTRQSISSTNSTPVQVNSRPQLQIPLNLLTNPARHNFKAPSPQEFPLFLKIHKISLSHKYVIPNYDRIDFPIFRVFPASS